MLYKQNEVFGWDVIFNESEAHVGFPVWNVEEEYWVMTLPGSLDMLSNFKGELLGSDSSIISLEETKPEVNDYPRIEVVSGDEQVGVSDAFLALPVEIAVTQSGAPVEGIGVWFQPQDIVSEVSEDLNIANLGIAQEVVTDVNGVAKCYVYLTGEAYDFTDIEVFH